LWTEWYENGQKSSEGIYMDEERYGLWTWWYSNGDKSTEVTYGEGPIDEFTFKYFYSKNGQKLNGYTFKNGELISEKYYNEDGSVKEVIEY
ncbi:MAG: hypothetical protein QF835_00880, partial [Candidatus Marinimicrobia bacterium]|nr:hypothetical protein [Candidatus Neomarinimicrobiota bacterium]